MAASYYAYDHLKTLIRGILQSLRVTYPIRIIGSRRIRTFVFWLMNTRLLPQTYSNKHITLVLFVYAYAPITLTLTYSLELLLLMSIFALNHKNYDTHYSISSGIFSSGSHIHRLMDFVKSCLLCNVCIHYTFALSKI